MQEIKKQNLLFEGIAKQLVANPLNAKKKPATNKYEYSAQLFEVFKEKLLASFSGLVIGKNKIVINFNKGERPIVGVAIQVDCLKITLNAKIGTLNDSKKLMRDISKIGHWGSGDYEVKVGDEEHFDYILELIKQVY